MSLAYWNGCYQELHQLKIPAWDRSVFFGDAVYEVIRIYKGQLWLSEEHYRRLERSLESVNINANLAQIKEWNHTLLETSGITEGILYFQVSRGEGPRSHVPLSTISPNTLGFVKEIQGDPYKRQRSEGARVSLQEDRRWGRCDIKSTNLMANLLAQQLSKSDGFDEAVLFNKENLVTEGSQSSLLMVRQQTVFAPPSGTHLLPGITRNYVEKLCKDVDIAFREMWFSTEELLKADEVFLAGTTTEVLPVTQVDTQAIGSGKPGPVCLTLQKLYRSRIGF